jgi:serine/threonine-protein kinase
MRSAMTRQPRNPALRRALGRILVAQQAFDSAEEVYHDAIRENPRYYGAFEDLGWFYWTQGRYEDSIMQYEQVVELAPAHDAAFNMLGAANYRLENWPEATKMFETSFALGKNYGACSNLGTLYYMDRRYADAASMFELALEYEEDNHVLVGNLAAALRGVPGREDESRELDLDAASLARRDLVSEPGDPRTLAYLAGYIAETSPGEADSIATRAAELAPEDGEVLYRAAMVYEELGQRTRALRHLGLAIDHGYPVREINAERSLDHLREDPRYQLLLPST